MALQSKDFSVTAKSSSGRITYTYILRVTENSIDIAKNSSNVTVEAILKQTYSGLAFSGYRTGVSCQINGQTLFSDYCRRSIEGQQEHIYYTWQGDMPHDDNGRLTLAVSGRLWQTTPAEYTPPEMVIPEGELALTAIARASKVGASDGTIGGRSIVVITPVATGELSYILEYAFLEENGFICQDGSVDALPHLLNGTTISFQIPESFYAWIPDQTEAVCRLICTTYCGNQCLGSSETTFRVMTDANSCRPLLRVSAEDVEPRTLAVTGDSGVAIRYLSKARVYVEAESRHHSRIVGKQVNGIEMTDAYLDIEGIQNEQIRIAAEDSRGYRKELEITMLMIPYVLLTSNAAIVRDEPTTGRATLTFSGNCYRGNLGKVDNRLLLRYRICPEGGSYGEWMQLETVAGKDHTYRLQIPLSDLDYTRTYTLQTQVEDQLETVSRELTLMPGVPVFHWNKEQFFFHVPVQCDGPVSGAYICSHPMNGADRLELKLEDGQTVFLAGGDGGVCGAVGSAGSWWGSPSVTAQQEDGKVSLVFSQSCAGELLLISTRPVSIQ